MNEQSNTGPVHGELAEIHHEHHANHYVTVTIDGKRKQIKPGEYVVAKLKEALGVDAAKELDQVRCGEFVPLDDTAKICIEGHEVFVSHVRSGGSS